MLKLSPSRPAAILQALFVTFLWSTSWVLIKIGLADIPPLTFAGLRYSMAFLCLLPFALRRDQFISLRKCARRIWMQLILLGVLYYTLTQGALFVGLKYLPSITISLVLNFTSVVVALLGIYLLNERPLLHQWSGIGLAMIGGYLYFYPLTLSGGQSIGYAAAILGVLANAGSSILGRSINREGNLQPLTVTVVSIGVGGLLLLVAGWVFQGIPPISFSNWLIIAWLAIANTAFAFTLWNHTLRTLTAMESSIINSTFTVHIAWLAWLFLGERMNGREITGMIAIGLGVLIVQMRRSRV